MSPIANWCCPAGAIVFRAGVVGVDFSRDQHHLWLVGRLLQRASRALRRGRVVSVSCVEHLARVGATASYGGERVNRPRGEDTRAAR